MKKKSITSLISKYDLGIVSNIEIFESSQNKVYKVTTNKGIYVVKEFSKDAIGNYYYLRKRKEQIKISKKLNDLGVKTVIPMSHNDKFFINFNKKYYLIYDYVIEKPLEEKNITTKHISILASTQSKIHKLNIKNNLTCSYKKININLDKQLKIAKRVNNELYITIKNNKDTLDNIINNCNEKIRIMKNNLCISHNDYKLLNILWKDYKMKLIDFDATGLSNPTCSLCESAYTFSKTKEGINYSFYKEYLLSYIKEYGNIKENYLDGLYASFNGKLQWLSYMFSKNHLKQDNYIEGTMSMINELVTYYNNIEKFNKIYLEIISE